MQLSIAMITKIILTFRILKLRFSSYTVCILKRKIEITEYDENKCYIKSVLCGVIFFV